MSGSRKRHRRFYLGQAGEYFVLFRLLERGLSAALAPPGAPEVDILVSKTVNHVVATIQVKTRSERHRTGGWIVTSRDLLNISDLHFFVFVDFEDAPERLPSCYVVPSAVVSKICRLMRNDEFPERVAYLPTLDDGSMRSVDRSRQGDVALNMHAFLPILRKPPRELGLSKKWMKEGFFEAYWIISTPLFKHRSPESPT